MDTNIKYLTESAKPYTPRVAMEEAARCLLCHDAPCSQSCPAGTNPAKFIRSLRFKNVKGAVETIREANVLGATCARVCPYDRLCEEACSRCGIDKPIEIGRLQQYAMDYEKNMGMEVLTAPEPTKGMVSVIGSGPAGLATATSLAQKGYAVTIFDDKEKAGGVLSYGIVPSRLPQDVVDYEVSLIEKLGVKFELGCKIGTDVSLAELEAKGFDAFVLAIGLQEPRMPNIPGVDLKGVTNAVEFLASAKPSNGDINVPDNVVIIGGGDVAMDCATTAKLLGSKKVSIVYRRTYEEMPANKAEVKHTSELGVNLFFGFAPEMVKGEDKVNSFLAKGFVDNAKLELDADLVVFAIGQVAEDPKSIANLTVSLDSKNLVLANAETCETNVANIFAAGDVVNGGKTVVEAVAAGKLAADSVDKYLSSLSTEGVK